MLSRFSVIAVLLLVDLSFDAAPLKGVILANEVGGTPMAKVTVTAAVGLTRFLHHVMAALRNDRFCGDGEVFVQRRAKGCRKSGIRRHRG
jgi:hypothetical protein